MSDPVQLPPPRQPGAAGSGAGLYSVSGIVVGTFISSLAAGIVMLYLNYRALGKAKLARTVAIWGTAIFVVIQVVASFAPTELEDLEQRPMRFLVFGLTFAVLQSAIAYFLANRLQGAAIRYHRESGGRVYSDWRAAGVGLLTGMALWFIIINILAIMNAVTGGGG
jgi:MFS family permease